MFNVILFILCLFVFIAFLILGIDMFKECAGDDTIVGVAFLILMLVLGSTPMLYMLALAL